MTPQKVKLAPMNPTATDQPQCSSAGPATQRMASMPTQSATRLKTNRITRRNRSSFVNPTASQFHRLRIHTWPAPRAAQYPSTITKTTSRQAPARTTPPRVAHHYRVSGLVQRGCRKTYRNLHSAVNDLSWQGSKGRCLPGLWHGALQTHRHPAAFACGGS